MKFDLIPSVICPSCGIAFKLPGGEKDDPVHCPHCEVTSYVTKKDLRLLKPEEFEIASKKGSSTQS
jgi:hypothetical protein